MYTGHKIAIVADEAGTTRDISEFEYTDEKNDLTYILADSGGLDYSSEDDEIAVDITERTEKSIIDSDMLIWVVEYDRFTQLDQYIYRVIKQHKVTNFIVIANKADNENQVMEAWSLAGKGELEFFPVSSSHNAGLGEVRRFIAKNLVSRGLNFKKGEEEDTLKMAFVGRPNVGKSSIVNSIVGNDRVMVKDMAGTTRDAIDTKFHYGEEDFTLIDTAGIRRLSRVGTRNIENWSIMRSERALKRADVIAVIVDGFEGLVQQDLSLIGRTMEEKKGLIIVVNKWDKVLDKPGVNKAHMMERYIDYLKEKIEFLPWVSVIFTSATEKKRLTNILDEALKIAAERKKRVKTSILNEFLEQAIYKHPPTGNKKSHSPKIYYGTQADTNPPKFVISVNNPNHFHFSYKRYLENKIRDNFGFSGTPITIEFRGRGKYADVVK
jgi:GTP-binding protein